jgi:hypothetical protein
LERHFKATVTGALVEPAKLGTTGTEFEAAMPDGTITLTWYKPT